MTADPEVRAVLLTRFNLPTGGREGLIRAQDGWLRDRWVLFERFTVPSVRHQSHSLTWLVYVDPESPPWFLESIGPYEANGLLVVVQRTSVSRADLRHDLRTVVGVRRDERLVTINLDNDDGLADDFVARVCANDPGGPEPTAIYLERGLIRTADALFAHIDRSNAFCAVAEPGAEPVTCWADWHNLLSRSMAHRVVAGPPGWLQVVHGRNVSNRVRGVRVDPARHAARFGALVSDLPPVPRSSLLVDTCVRQPLRRTRDSVRRLVKTIAFRLLGKRGWDAAKSAVSRLRAELSQRLMR